MRLCDLSSAEVYQRWDGVRGLHDDITGRESAYSAQIITGLVRDGISWSLEADRIWREREPEFFEANPYLWASDAHSYDFSTEAAYQVRVFELLFEIWKRRSEYRLDANLFGDIAVRQVVHPKFLGTTPRAIKVDGSGFIVIPSGWLIYAYYMYEACQSLQDRNHTKAVSIIREVISGAITDVAIRNVRKYNAAPSVPDEIVAFARGAVCKALGATPEFSGAYGDLIESELRSEWRDLSYAASTFVLGHETAHILVGEHLGRASSADEERADSLAFDMLALSTAWMARCRALPVRTPLGMTCAAAAGFIFINLSRLALEAYCTGADNSRLDAFTARANSLSIIAGVQEFPKAERIMLNELAAIMRDARTLQAEVTRGIDDACRRRLIAEAMAEYARIIRAEAASAGLTARR